MSQNNKKLYRFLLLQGIYSQFIQVILIRQLITRFSGIELTLSFALCSAMFWTALGCALSKKIRSTSNTSIMIALSLSPLAAILSFIFAAISPPIIDETYQLSYSLNELALFCILTPLPFGLINGAIFGLISITAQKSKAHVCYALDALGDTIGALLFSLVLAKFVPPLLLIGVSGLMIPVLTITNIKTKKAYTSLAVASIFLSLLFSFQDKTITSLFWKKILPGYTYQNGIETAYGRVDFLNKIGAADYSGQKAIYCNGSLIGTLPKEKDIYLPATMFAVLQPNKNKLNVLLIASPFSPVSDILSSLPILNRLDQLCPQKRLYQIAQKLELIPPLSKLDRLQRIFADERAFLEKSNNLQYDLIIVYDRQPSTLQDNRFFTQEFYTLILKKLNPNGVFVTSMPSSSGYITKKTKEFNSSMVKTLQHIFPKVTLTGGQTKLIAAGRTNNTSANFSELDKRLENLLPEYDDYPPGMMAVDFSQSEQHNEMKEITNFIKNESLKINTDSHPILPYHFLGMHSRIISGDINKPGFLITLLERLTLRWGWGVAILLLFYFSLKIFFNKILKKKNHFNFFSFENGFFAMGVEINLLILYQNRCGALYNDLAACLGIFILGTAIGAYYGYQSAKILKFFQRCSLLIPLLLPIIFVLPQSSARLFIFILLFLTGIAIGFTYKMLNTASPGKHSGFRLWVWEMSGGALGAVFFSLFLLPAAGLIPCLSLLFLCRLPLLFAKT